MGGTSLTTILHDTNYSVGDKLFGMLTSGGCKVTTYSDLQLRGHSDDIHSGMVVYCSIHGDPRRRANGQKFCGSSVLSGSSDLSVIVHEHSDGRVLSNGRATPLVCDYHEEAVKYVDVTTCISNRQAIVIRVGPTSRLKCSGNRLALHPGRIVKLSKRVFRCCHCNGCFHHRGWSRIGGCNCIRFDRFDVHDINMRLIY